MAGLFMTAQEVEDTFGKIEYVDLARGWVKITNTFESKYLKRTQLPYFYKPLLVHRKIIPALTSALEKIEKLSMIFQDYEYIENIQIFAPRHVAQDRSKRLSCHSYGIAFDINPWENMPGVMPYGMPSKIVQVFEYYGFAWGGNMKVKDWMHFEPARNFFDHRNRWEHGAN